jgi:RAT1-interacting protein
MFKAYREDMTPHHLVQTYYGYAFESWCTASTPHASTGWGGDVDTNVQWCSVVKTKLGDTRIVIGGEVDCVRGIIFIMCPEAVLTEFTRPIQRS